jgi:hypothetical protein
MKRASLAAAAMLLGAVCLAGGASAKLPLAPISTLAHVKAAPAPGALGPEGVPIPDATVLADPQVVKLNQTIDGVTCQAAEKVAYHIHAHLTIFVDGKARAIPYGVGVGPPLEGENTPVGPFVTLGSCFMWLHTHAADGIIHIESPTEKTYTLGQFFAVWGQPLSKMRVGPAKGPVTTFYDGKVWTGNPGEIPLTSETQIQLDVGAPVVAPEHIRFPSGLAAAMSKSK